MAEAAKKTEARTEPVPDYAWLESVAKRHSEVASDAGALQSMTSEEAWQSIYHERRRDFRDRRLALGKSLRVIADSNDGAGLDEDDEKALKTVAKDSADLRADESAWERMVCEPINRVTLSDDNLRRQALAQAEKLERDAPLHNRGVLAETKRRMASWPSFEWKRNDGRLVVHNPEA